MHTTYSISERDVFTGGWKLKECPLLSWNSARGHVRNLYQVENLEACRTAISDDGVVSETLNAGRLNEMIYTSRIIEQFIIPVVEYTGGLGERVVVISQQTEVYTNSGG
jgi:hypothetical protein